MNESKSTRRGVVASGIALLSGLGIGAATTHRASAAPPTTGTSARAVRRLELRAPRLNLGDPDATPGIPGRPSRLEGDSVLLDPRGRPAGTFNSLVLPSGRDGVELHTFQLDGGTLLGMGRVGGYAIVGGTGGFAGASGAYVFEHQTEARGGDGSANFVIDLTA